MSEPDQESFARLTPTPSASLTHWYARPDSASLAVLEPRHGHPLASRVGVATDADGAPLILVSHLSAHTPAMLADPRCSLLVGEPGKGDPLAHPRVTLVCRAERLEPGTPADSPRQSAAI